MRIVISDIETNGLDGCDRIHLFGGIDVTTGERFRFDNITTIKETREKALEWAKTVDLWVGHYFLTFDAPTINRLMGTEVINLGKVIDTVIISELVDFDTTTTSPDGRLITGHSLDSWGERLGKPKGKFNDWTKLTQEMVDYWEQDLDVSLELYKHFLPIITDKQWKKSLRCEHDTVILLNQCHYNGFSFDKPKAEELLVEVEARMKILEDQFQIDFPPQLQEVNRLKYRLLKDTDTPTKVVQKALDSYPKTEIVLEDDGTKLLVCYGYINFNAGSPKQRVERLWEAGWKPVDMTKTHQEYVRDRKREMYKENKSKWGK